ncbi:hypothetical protein EN943_08170 [Mesorhizobium sp. M7A.F.Ca.US.006.01.1.1]|nr:hypothetical protein [Mesorhizobium sp. M7A.F.Ca.US.006.01.1.1]RUZ79181.1 hypothetical protein EN943_08170 [Mesorhizobium sp. M7A.F.Ca.US.006.01.1.1]
MSVKWSSIGASNAIGAQGEDSIWSSASAALQTAKSRKAVAIDPEFGSMN